MSRDDRIAAHLGYLVCALLLFAFVAAHSLHPRTGVQPISPTTSSTTTTSPTVTTVEFMCFDRDGYPIHTDAATAARAHLACTTGGTRP